MPNTALNMIELANAVVGCDGLSSEQAEEIRSVIESKLPSSIEVGAIYGGQPVYYYIISAE